MITGWGAFPIVSLVSHLLSSSMVKFLVRLFLHVGFAKGILSLLIFLLYVQSIFFFTFSRCCYKGYIWGSSVSGCSKIFPPFFAEDSILFARATLHECSTIANIISLYDRASCQRVNYSKTEMSLSTGVPQSTKDALAALLNVRKVDRHEKYLGLPTIIRKSKKAIFSSPGSYHEKNPTCKM